MRIIELILNDNDEVSGIDAVSVVHSPAIEENFIALHKHEVELKKNEDTADTSEPQPSDPN